jgi:E3 ubiquitin-protein ligase HECTD1
LKDDDCFEVRPGKRRSWDDEFVLKRQFSALIPAFDPRPGRTNVNQITELEIPQSVDTNASTRSTDSDRTSGEECLSTQPKLRLILRGPNLPGVSTFVFNNILCLVILN